MKPRILIVDDEKGIRFLYARYCQTLGYDTDQAGSGQEALEKLNDPANEYDAVTADIHLGDMLGTELIKELKRIHPELSVVVSTGAPSQEIMQECILAGIDGFIVKPISFEQFRTTLAKAVDHTRNARYSSNKMLELEKLLKVKMAEYDLNVAGTIEALIEGTEQKDRYTKNHSRNVAHYAEIIAGRMGLPVEKLQTVKHAAFLHDVGKIWIQSEILNKKGALTPEEREIMERHPAVAARILIKIPSLQPLIPAIRHHHEHYNGGGYPDNLVADEIPLYAAIIGVAGAFDAMTSDRPYRGAMDFKTAAKILQKERGRQFHPQCVDALTAFLQDNRFAPLTITDEEFDSVLNSCLEQAAA